MDASLRRCCARTPQHCALIGVLQPVDDEGNSRASAPQTRTLRARDQASRDGHLLDYTEAQTPKRGEERNRLRSSGLETFFVTWSTPACPLTRTKVVSYALEEARYHFDEFPFLQNSGGMINAHMLQKRGH